MNKHKLPDKAKCDPANEAVLDELPGYVEVVPKGAKAFGRYKFRVIGRDEFANHHTNSRKDADQWLEMCRKFWEQHPKQ